MPPKQVAASSHRTVYTHGVPWGTAHRQAFRNGRLEERTLCGNWPGQLVQQEPDARCPVCFDA